MKKGGYGGGKSLIRKIFGKLLLVIAFIIGRK
jgi:hypothetical protein